MDRQLRVGVVGLGGAGRAHVRRLLSNPKADVVAVFDPDSQHLDQASKELGLARSVDMTNNWAAFLSNQALEAVSICSPDYAHAQQSIDCLSRGLHVRCEKPMSTSSEEALGILDVAASTRLKFMVHHQMRYVPAFCASKLSVDRGELGTLIAIEADYYHDMRQRASAFDNWRLDPVAFQRIVLGGGCHPIDLMQWLASDAVVEAFAYASHRAFTDYPDVDTVYSVLKFRSGMLGRMTMTIGCSRPQYNPLTVVGTEATLVNGLMLKSGVATRVLHDPSECVTSLDRILWALLKRVGNPIHFPFNHYEHEFACRRLVDDFLDAAITDGTPPIPPFESMDTIRVCEAIIESYRTGTPVAVNRESGQ